MSSVYSQTHVARARETETVKTSSPSICRLDSLFNTIGKKKKYTREGKFGQFGENSLLRSIG